MNKQLDKLLIQDILIKYNVYQLLLIILLDRCS